ncbi:hypothetical protein [Mesobacillus maritimus]|uniref:hypothetical protein n=1 Tax=Mesobacillus maritimus TaxID=1643336 RepID=UPI0038504B8B
MGTEWAFQCRYSGKAEEYGHRVGVSMPILRKSRAVWAPSGRFNADTQEKWKSMGTGVGVSMPILRKSGRVWAPSGRFNADTQEKWKSMGTEETSQFRYSGKAEQYGNRGDALIPKTQ